MQSSELFFFVPLIQSQDDLSAAASRCAPQQSRTAGTVPTRRGVPQGRQANRIGKAAHGTMTTRPRKSGGSQMSQSRSSSDLAAMGSPCRLTPCGSADFAEVFAAVCACGPNDDDDDFDDDAGEKQPPCVDTASQKHHRPLATTTTTVLPSPIIPMIRSFSELERGGCMVSIHEVTTTTTDGNVEVLVTISVGTSPLVEGHAKGTSAFAPPSVSTGTVLAVHKPANAWTQRNTQRQRQSAARRAAKEQASRLRLQLMELSRDCFAGRFRIEREATQGLKATSLEARRSTALERASPQKRQQQLTAAPASCSPDKLASRGLTALSQDALLSMAHEGSAPVEAVVVTSSAAPVTMTGGADDVYEPEDILVLRAALQNLGSVMELRSKAAHHIHALLKPGETGVRDAAAKRAARDRNELQETLQLLGNHLLREAERRIAADMVANDDDENDHPAGKSAGRQLSTEASSILQFCASAWQVATAAATPQRKLPSPPHSTVKCRRTRSQDENSAAAGGGSDAIESAPTAPTLRRTVLHPESSERITAAMRSARASRSMISAFYLDLERLLKVTIGDSQGGSSAPPRGLDEVHTAAEVLVTAIGALVSVVDSDPSAVAVPLRWAEVDRLAVAVATAWKTFDDRLEASRVAARDGLIHGLCHAYVSMFRVLSAARGSATSERATATTTTPSTSAGGDTHADPQTTAATAQAAARRHAQAAAFRQARRREATTAAAAEMSRLLQQLRRIGGQAAVDRATQLAAAATTA